MKLNFCLTVFLCTNFLHFSIFLNIILFFFFPSSISSFILSSLMYLLFNLNKLQCWNGKILLHDNFLQNFLRFLSWHSSLASSRVKGFRRSSFGWDFVFSLHSGYGFTLPLNIFVKNLSSFLSTLFWLPSSILKVYSQFSAGVSIRICCCWLTKFA